MSLEMIKQLLMLIRSYEAALIREGGLDSWKDDYDNEYIKDGYFHESELHSAPAFAIDIDGIDSVEK